MGNIISEGLEHIGSISDNGYVFDPSFNHIAQIHEDGYITKPGGGAQLGKIDEDGTIYDSLSNAIGRIQADGYVYIHSNRVCKVSSAFMEKITPKAWNAGDYSSFDGRKTETVEESYGYGNDYGSSGSSFPTGLIIKLIIGVGLGLYAWISNFSEYGFGGILFLLIAPIVVIVLCFIAKLIFSCINN